MAIQHDVRIRMRFMVVCQVPVGVKEALAAEWPSPNQGLIFEHRVSCTDGNECDHFDLAHGYHLVGNPNSYVHALLTDWRCNIPHSPLILAAPQVISIGIPLNSINIL